MFGFGYYEGHRNTNGNTQNIVVLTDAQRTGNFGTTTIRDPLTGAAFPGNTIPADRLDHTALRLIDEFIPRANSGGNRYIVSPDSTDDRDQMGVRVDYQLSREARHAGALPAQPDRSDRAADHPADRQRGQGDAAGLHGVGHHRPEQQHDQRRAVLVQPDWRQPRRHERPVEQRLRHQRAAKRAVGAGLANIVVTGFFSLGDAQQPFVERINEVFQFTDDFTWISGRHALKFGIDIRKEHMVIAFVNRPNGDFTFTGSPTSRSGNAAADFLLGLPTQFRRTTANASQDGTDGCMRATCRTSSGRRPNLTLNAGLRYEVPLPFVDKNDALNAFRPGQQSTRFPQAPTGLVYPGDRRRAARHLRDGQEQLRARAWAWRGIPPATARSSLRAAWGIFYDALAGQGDFFQNGVLAPPFTPLVEVNAPPDAITLRNPLSAISGGPAGFPPGLTFIGWGEDFSTPYAHHFNATWQQQLGDLLGGGDRLRRLARQEPADLHRGEPRRLSLPDKRAVGPRLFPAFALVRPTFSVAKSWYDSLQASLRMRPAHGMSFLLSYTLGHAVDHVSGLNIGGEQRPVLPVHHRRRGLDRARAELRKGRRVVRRAPSVRRQLRRGVRHAAKPRARRRDLAGGWQLNGIVQAQTGFPLTVFDPSLSIRFLTNRPNQICDPNADAPHTIDQWFNTSCFAAPRACRKRREPGSTPRNSVRGPGFVAHRPVAVQEHAADRQRTACSSASRRSTCSTRRASVSPAVRSARRTSVGSPARTTGGSSSWR